MGQFTEFGERSGHLDLIDWDRAVIMQTGAIYDEEQNEWYLPLDFYVEEDPNGAVHIERALVVYKRPEPTQVQHVVPEIAILRDDIDPAEERITTTVTQYRLPAAGATPVSINGVLGWTHYETKEKDRPYNFTYTIECWARYATVAQFLLQRMMIAFPLRGTITVIAKEEANRDVANPRTYLTVQEGIANLTEVNSMVERIPGWGLTTRIEGELTLDRIPTTVPAFTGIRSPDPLPLGPGSDGSGDGTGAGNIDYPGGNPNLPGNGLYGTGAPNIRATTLED